MKPAWCGYESTLDARRIEIVESMRNTAGYDEDKLITEVRGRWSQLPSVKSAHFVCRDTALSQCIDAGASFITAPGFNAQIVEFAAKHKVAVLAGALTPTEVIEAWETGSDFVKVFPCAPVGG